MLSTGEREESGLRSYTLHRCWPLAVVLTMVALALLIVSAVQPALYTARYSSPLGDVHFTVGAFRLCYSAGELSGCRDIDSACEVQPLERLPDVKGTVVDECDSWNSARVLQVLAVLFVVAGLLCQLCAAMRAWVKGSSMLAFTLTLLGALCGLVSMALYATLRKGQQSAAMENADVAYGFTLLVIGWLLAFIAALAFWPCGD